MDLLPSAHVDTFCRDHLPPAEQLNVRRRETGYRRHNFAGLNALLVELFRQHDDVLGVRKTDFMTGSQLDADNAVAAGEAFRRGDLAAVLAAISDEMVEAYCAAGPIDKVRARVEATAERADGLFLTPPTYFISPEELSEYQNRIIDAFGPEA